jgi:D-alanyl-D-alanine carboxypeptidase/D-alanyl-D-alanine-endopeptidase (penicillin-binding protein 4)
MHNVTSRHFLSFLLFFIIGLKELEAQAVIPGIKEAVRKMTTDQQMKHASWSLVIADASTGKFLFDLNGEMGLAPASTLKILTSIASFEILGKNYRYDTRLGYHGQIKNGILNGNLVLYGSGDPSFGSWRYTESMPQQLLNGMTDAVLQAGIREIHGTILTDTTGWNYEPVPDGWIWQDIGNYYGAGAQKLNWHENQYDILLRPGRKGEPAEIVETKPPLYGIQLLSELVTGEKGSGDNAYIYLAPGSKVGVIRGTIPEGEDNFSISGSIHNPALQLSTILQDVLQFNNIRFARNKPDSTIENKNLWTSYSPAFDSLNQQFLKKSINLYGEAFLKTIAFIKTGNARTEKGVELLKEFWKGKGIDENAIQIIDGSGLSPQNRTTAKSLVQALQFARGRNWFPSFFNALPVYNNMKLKSGSINGCRAFAGYHTSRAGKTYTVAIIVNNYSGSTSEMISKIFHLLDYLK